MKQISNVRKAYASKGDDTTFTRWIKEPGRHSVTTRPTTPMREDAIGTRFPSRVMKIEEMTSILVSGHSNVKVGRDVRKGRMYRGYWIFTLSLEERKTCPSSCRHWTTCYGNAMPLAKRVDHLDPEFLPALEKEIDQLCRKKGILIRLHALGDFYSVEYVNFWRRMLHKHRRLAVFGYTANPITSDIGFAVQGMNYNYFERCTVRYSGGNLGLMDTVSISTPDGRPANSFICPEQLNRADGCGKCGLCWSTTKTVAFLEH